jgi:hypothetical protein
MATNPVLKFHDGKLDVPEELQRDWKLHEGSELRVVSSSAELIVLESAGDLPGRIAAAIKHWRSLEGILPDLRTPEWEAQAVARKQHAADSLKLLYESGNAGATELKQAERKWELADDELDFGPITHR